MWLEQIKKFMSENSYISPQVAADISEIREAELKLNVTFPDELVSLLSEVNGDKYLLWSAEDIMRYNIDTRRDFAGCYDDLDKYLFVAGNGCGDYYGYIINDGKISGDELVRWEHETNESIPVADSLRDLIEKYYTDLI